MKYDVMFAGKVYATQRVTVADEFADPVEAAFPGGFPLICFQCAGVGKDYRVEFPEYPTDWEVVEATPVEEE